MVFGELHTFGQSSVCQASIREHIKLSPLSTVPSYLIAPYGITLVRYPAEILEIWRGGMEMANATIWKVDPEGNKEE